ncbi:DNA mismatch repair protein MutS [Clostridia bacterium]|nr:DNA mismatch repair protein MutS [Clostridia bacterium]
MTPMMRQYFDQKAKNPDCLLFFRLGDFYEMFAEDARTAARELQLTLTTRDHAQKDVDARIPMCGLPYHAATGYIAKLIERGYKVAICEQMEDPATAKGLVERAVTRVITPGTVIDEIMLDEKANNYVAATCEYDEAIGVCFADASTGVAQTACFEGKGRREKAQTALDSFAPRETITAEPSFDLDHIRLIFGDKPANLVESIPAAACAVTAVLRYLEDMQKSPVRMGLLTIFNDTEHVEIDARAQKNLELFTSLSGDKSLSLLGVLDRTSTPMGARLLRSDIALPLRDAVKLDNRLIAVDTLLKNAAARDELRLMLKHFPDLERMIQRVVYSRTSHRELLSLAEACGRLPGIRKLMEGLDASVLQLLYASIDPLIDEAALCQNALDADSVIRDGYHPEIDRLRGIKNNSLGVVAQMETEERAKTGIKTLKIGYNGVFGYFLEVSKSYLSLVPEEWRRRQTLSNCERFVTEPLKLLEREILSAQDKLDRLERELFAEVCATLAREIGRFQRTARALARLDVLLSLAEVAARNRYCRPVVDMSDRLELVESRHPVVENALKDGLFVPNDVKLNGANPVIILTGPNMAGKSTYMRQVAVIAVMAHIGSFVPAKSARIGVLDKIFTRIGAQDDLSGGRSTFMVEMTEVADILKHATKRSLLILDEIGRGTSTYDGMAVARAVLEHTAAKLGAKALFATHYHELTALEGVLKGVRSFNVAVKKRGREIVFLRKIVPGGADDSYGVEVARLAGLPESVIDRAAEVLEELESNAQTLQVGESVREPMQVSFDGGVVDMLRKIDVNTLTPIEAMQKLFELQRRANG